MKRLFLLLSLFAATSVATAKVELPSILGSGMVLQQKTDAALWGKAKAGSTVTVETSWNRAKTTTKANAQGAWQTTVATPSFGGPYTISISDGERLKLENILIGEVWICSGQSNMEMPVVGFTNQPVNGSVNVILGAASVPNIRLFTVPRNTSDKPLDNCGGEWELSSPESVANFSATAYFFALNLSRSLNGIPVGVVNTSWGGTMIQPWMPAECSERVMDENYLKANPKHQDYQKMGYLYNAMLYPLRNFAARGFLWYQGESNLTQNKIGKNGTKVYANLMQEMVAQWRRDWRDKNNAMPFLYVQIAPYNYNNGNDIERALLVENQVDALKLIPNSGMAATTDIGDATGIHPAQKGKVGERLALLAMDKAYNIAGKLPVNGPAVKQFEFKNGSAFVILEPAMGGFDATDRSKILGFELCGDDKVFYPSDAAFTNNGTVIEVKSDKVAAPVAVRYAFRNYVEINLFNALGIPPYSFRSDNF